MYNFMYVKIRYVVFRMNIPTLLQYQFVLFYSHTDLPCELSHLWTHYPIPEYLYVQYSYSVQ